MGKATKRALKVNARERAKAAYVVRAATQTPNQIAEAIRGKSDGFIFSPEWRAIRLRVFAAYGTDCMRCGHRQTVKQRANVDHIKPRKLFPELSLDFSNLQVLCPRCNKNKGNFDQTDYRPGRVTRPSHEQRVPAPTRPLEANKE